MAGGVDALKFSCAHCGQYLEADPKMAGRMARCPFCKKEITIPAAKPVIAVVKRRKGSAQRYLKWLFFIIIVILGVMAATIWGYFMISEKVQRARESANSTKAFEGVVISVEDEGVLNVLDKDKFFEYKVRLDKIKVHEDAKGYISRRQAVEVRVTYTELDGDYVKGIVWEKDSSVRSRNDALTAKSLNDILVDEGYASYDNQ